MNFLSVYITIIDRVLRMIVGFFKSLTKNTDDIKITRYTKNGGEEMSDLSNTQFFQVEPGPQISARDILEIVFKALKEKGYNPVNQIVGYIMSGDPTYITSYNGARSLIMKVERDELVEELLKAYIAHNSWE